MFAQNTPAFPLLAFAAYALSALWVVGTQVIALRRVGRSFAGAVAITFGGELLALVPGALVVAAAMAAVEQGLRSAGVGSAVVDTIVVNDFAHRPTPAAAMLFAWLVVWGAVAVAMKAVFLRFACSAVADPWRLATAMSVRAYAGTAVAAAVVMLALVLG